MNLHPRAAKTRLALCRQRPRLASYSSSSYRYLLVRRMRLILYLVRYHSPPHLQLRRLLGKINQLWNHRVPLASKVRIQQKQPPAQRPKSRGRTRSQAPALKQVKVNDRSRSASYGRTLQAPAMNSALNSSNSAPHSVVTRLCVVEGA
ncbi:uncharacterized protein LOC117304374 [Asterias rubens]|uniref:uncharacterized protein LOC117304374 n=1 Tax=Asterias rubens TaxID=7604 RepID=UPI001455A3A0|nr:uncharacterized protein LOC117304374 [Asterias rubens]